MKSIFLSAISVLWLSHNLFAMETPELGAKISRVFETYKMVNDSGLRSYALSADNGLMITTRWENLAKVYAFFGSNAHKELKSLFGLNSQSIQGIDLVRDVQVEDPDGPIEVINSFAGNTFRITIRNF